MIRFRGSEVFMIESPPPGQGPIDPRGALAPPPPPGAPGGIGPAGGSADPRLPAPSPAAGSYPQMMNPADPPAGPRGGAALQTMTSGPVPGFGAPPGFAPPRRGGGAMKTVLLVVVSLLLIGSLLFNVMLAGNFHDTTTTQTLVAGDSSQQIAVIPLSGLIDEANEARLIKHLDRARQDAYVKAVVLMIDTPGGSVTASDEIYKSLVKFKTDKGVKLVVAMRGMATSGGYYAACAGDYIVAEPTTLTGNIGVIMPGYNFSKLMEKYGIEEHTIVSTGATYKNAGSMFHPQSARDDAYLQDIADSAFVQFKQVVQTGRTNKLKQPIDEIANGKAYTAHQAFDLGLVDEIDNNGYLDAAVKWASAQAGLTRPQVVRYQEAPTLMDIFSSSSKFVGGQGSAGGVSINIDPAALDRLRSPRAMYLFQAP